MSENTYQTRKESFLVAPVIAASGRGFSLINDCSYTLRDLGEGKTDVPEGTPQILYDFLGRSS